MIERLKERLDKKDDVMLVRWKFDQRRQGPNESSENYILALKLLAENCDFGDRKDGFIRDRIIFGLYDKELQKKLFRQVDLTLANVEQIVVRSELADLRSQVFGDESGRVLSVKHRLGRRYENNFDDDYEKSRSRNRNQVRFRSRSSSSSGRSRSYSHERAPRRYSDFKDNRDFPRNRYDSNRFSRNFRFSNSRSNFRNVPITYNHDNLICNRCGNKGHIKRNCNFQGSRQSLNFVDEREMSNDETYNFKRLRLNNSGNDDDDDDDNDDDVFACMMIATQRSKSEPCMVDAYLDGKKVRMEIDCGAAVSVISVFTYDSLFSHIPMHNCQSKLVVVNGKSLDIFGKIFVKVELNGAAVKVWIIVLKTNNNFSPLFGRNLMDIFYPNWRSTFVVSNQVNNINVDHGENKDMGFEADLVLKEHRPIFKKAYEVPYKLREKFYIERSSQPVEAGSAITNERCGHKCRNTTEQEAQGVKQL